MKQSEPKLPIKILFSTHNGLGVALENELKKYSIPLIAKGKSFCVAEINSLEKAGELLYRIQTASNAIILISEFEFSNLDDLENKFSKLDLTELEVWINEKYFVRCVRIGHHDFSSPDVVEIGQKILSKKIKPTGGGFSAETKFYVEDQQCFFGVDLAGIDMSKRDYRIFRHSASIKGTVASCILALSDIKPVQNQSPMQNQSAEKSENPKTPERPIMIDPFCKDATICIECAFWTGKSAVRKFSWESLSIFKLKPFRNINWADLKQEWDLNDTKESIYNLKIIGMDSSNHNLSSARKNIQISGLKDEVELVKEDLEWLSTRFEDDSVSLIATSIPSPTKRLVEKIAKKIYAEFLEESFKILKKDGLIVTYVELPETFIETAKLHNFSVKKKILFHMGKQPASIIILEK